MSQKLSVVIPTLNAAASLGRTLANLVPAAVEGLVAEVIVVDGGSKDRTLAIAEDAGCTVVEGGRGRGPQLVRGARAARAPWLLFLHADTILEEGWIEEVSKFVVGIEQGGQGAAAVFRFALDDRGIGPACLESAVAARCKLLALPYGDQGLLISRRLYDEIGGFRELPLMEDVDIVRRLGRRRIRYLRTRATTSAERYRRDGYVRRAARNLTCLTLYSLGAPMSWIVRLYG